jgi:tRNA threonylcarbamoyladenosine biosynthesis protein TsaB
MKNVLAFDTSSPVLSVALKKGNESTSEAKLVGFLQHAENLLPIIDHLLKEKRLTIRDIDLFLIGRGPGSFTGLRIGFATLKGFLALGKKPCYGALSLDMITENAKLEEKAPLAVCLDAHREKIYARLYRRINSRWLPEGSIRVVSFSQLTDLLPEGSYVAGDALGRYGESFQNIASKKKIHFLPEAYWYPRAATLISWLTNIKVLQGSGYFPLARLGKSEDFLPLYFRLPEAEEKTKHHAAAC